MSINILELLEMVMTAYAMIVIKKDRPVKEGNSVLMRGDSSSAVQWVISCGRGKGEERSGRMMRIMGMLERIGRWSFQANHVRGVENTFVDGITWNEREIQTRLTTECPTVSLQARKLGVEGTEMCPEILRAATHSDELRSRLGGLMRKVGGCG